MVKVALACAVGVAPKSLQIMLYSLKNTSNKINPDIYLANTWKTDSHLKVIKDNDLGNNITFLQCHRLFYSHADALDTILDHIADKGYDYLFTTETDCRFMRDGWLDWYLDQVKDNPKIGICGWRWVEGRHHNNVNPSSTLYRMDMLLKYHKECRENKGRIYFHPNKNRSVDEVGLDPKIPDRMGVFSELRGIEHPTKEQLEAILASVPYAWHFEPAHWLTCRLKGEWEEVHVHADHFYTEYAGHRIPEGTYYGGKNNPYIIHGWAATRAMDFLKHEINDPSIRACTEHWVRRENSLWESTVPKKYHKVVHDLMIEMNTMELMEKHLGKFIPEVM